jgi:hypothetical protein
MFTNEIYRAVLEQLERPGLDVPDAEMIQQLPHVARIPRQGQHTYNRGR